MKHLLYVAGIALVAALFPVSAEAQTTIKVANWNIRSGMGRCGLDGSTCTFTDSTANCLDASAPLNAWGYGQPQAVLATLNADPEVVALALEEAWGCGSSSNVRSTLGWSYASPDYNGLALVTRFGISGSLRIRQVGFPPVDTEPRYVIGADVCLDATCGTTVRVYATHVGGATDDEIAVQTSAAVDWLTADSQGGPHLFVGDFNVSDPALVPVPCGPLVPSRTLQVLRDSGYADAWKTLGLGDGQTATLNRNGCGVPNGGAWKRIDYAWYKGFTPLTMDRFGIVPAGSAAPSDHYGIVARFWGAASIGVPTAPVPPPPAPPVSTVVPPAADVVLWASRAQTRVNWTVTADASAASGSRLQNPDLGTAKVTPALAAPAVYFEMTFNAVAGVPYHLWIRGKALANSTSNDSVHVQFDGSLTASGAAAYRIGTTSSVEYVLEECAGCGISGWGWQDNGWGSPGLLGPPIYFDTTGPHRLRVQAREDGIGIDQIVLSPTRWLTTPPGTSKNDTTILAETDAQTGNQPPTVGITSPVTGTGIIAPATVTITADASDRDGTIARVDFYANSKLIGSDDAMPFAVSWTAATPGTYTLTATATDSAGATATSSPLSVTVSSNVTGEDVVLYPAQAPLAVNWSVIADSTAAGGARLQNANAGAAKIITASSTPGSYFEMTFTALANRPYRLWIRGKATSDSYANDSVFVQFDASLDGNKQPAYRIATTSATEYNLEECSGCGLSGWGWQDNGWGAPGYLGPVVYFDHDGLQTIRVQVREDGLGIDQIVLSSVRWITTSPGPAKNDATILPKQN